MFTPEIVEKLFLFQLLAILQDPVTLFSKSKFSEISQFAQEKSQKKNNYITQVIIQVQFLTSSSLRKITIRTFTQNKKKNKNSFILQY